MAADRLPLGEKNVLDESVSLGTGGQLTRGAGPKGCAAVASFGGPFPPRFSAEMILKRGEERVAFQPRGMGCSKGGKIPVSRKGGSAQTNPGGVGGEKKIRYGFPANDEKHW